MLADYRYLGLTLGPHPMSLLRKDVDFAECRKAEDLASCRHDQFVQVAGLVTCRQRPGTATGVVFLTLEDETGNSNIIVWRTILDRFRAQILQGQLLRIKGVVQREAEVIHVIAGYVEDLSFKLPALSQSSTPSVADAAASRVLDAENELGTAEPFAEAVGGPTSEKHPAERRPLGFKIQSRDFH